MYGVVNNAIQKFILENEGTSTWFKVKRKDGIKHDSFNSMQSYPDQITYQLVDAASDILKLSQTAILESFGKYWIQYASGMEGYAHYFRLGKTGLFGFLNNLNRMHMNIGRVYPELQPPTFDAKLISPNQIKLVYFSDRPGLAPFVQGLIKGLGEHFNIPISVTQEDILSTSNGQCTFDILLK